MFSSYCSPSSPCLLLLPHPHTFFSTKPSPILVRKPTTSSITCLAIGLEQFAEIAQNKVLVAAVVSTAVGQLSKPFTSALFYGKGFVLKDLVRSGGFPSVHSASVVAAATSLGLERGFSDSIFGVTTIFAAIVMYDAQGVRREVGKHAKILNKKILWKDQEVGAPIDCRPGTPSKNSDSFVPQLSISGKTSSKQNAVDSPEYKSEIRSSGSNSEPSSLAVDGKPVSNSSNSLAPLEESIGHTEVEVIAGALLGFLVTLAVYSLT